MRQRRKVAAFEFWESVDAQVTHGDDWRRSGIIHRRSAQAGSEAERSRLAGDSYGIAADRAYSSYDEMFKREKLRADAIDFVAIVAPNDVHFAAVNTALNAGLAVMSDKPMTATYAEAQTLAKSLRQAATWPPIPAWQTP